MAIISTAAFKTYWGINVSTWDTQLGVLIPAAQATVERFCGRTFDTQTFTELYDGDNSGFIQLRSFPVSSVTSVKYVAVDGTKTALVSTAYKCDLDTGGLWLVPRAATKITSYDTIGQPFSNWTQGPSFVRGVQNYEVIYVAGYGTMPTDLQLAMYEYVGELFAPLKLGTIQDTSLKSESVGDLSYTRRTDAELREGLERRFGRFRRRVA